MILISFGRWSSASGPLFIRKRIYWNNTKWTPFVRVFWRYCKENSLDEAASAATATMYRLGYRWHGGVEWKPPLGPAPEFTEDRTAECIHGLYPDDCPDCRH